MIDRTRLAVSGALLAGFAFAATALLAWSDYQRDLDANQSTEFEWVPRYWDYLRSGMGLTMQFLVAVGIAMLVVAWTMRPTDRASDEIFRRPT